MTALQTAALDLAEAVNMHMELMPPALAVKLGALAIATFEAAMPNRPTVAMSAADTPPRGKPFLRVIEGGR